MDPVLVVTLVGGLATYIGCYIRWRLNPSTSPGQRLLEQFKTTQRHYAEGLAAGLASGKPAEDPDAARFMRWSGEAEELRVMWADLGEPELAASCGSLAAHYKVVAATYEAVAELGQAPEPEPVKPPPPLHPNADGCNCRECWVQTRMHQQMQMVKSARIPEPVMAEVRNDPKIRAAVVAALDGPLFVEPPVAGVFHRRPGDALPVEPKYFYRRPGDPIEGHAFSTRVRFVEPCPDDDGPAPASWLPDDRLQ